MDIIEYIQFNKKKINSQKYQMTEHLCIKLKPLFIEFYGQKDCPVNSRLSAIIQLNNTIYKTGIIKPQKNKFLQLITLSWISFVIDSNQSDCYISIQLISHHENGDNLSKYSEKANQNQLKYKIYKSMLPIDQLKRIPLNRKKKFNFPLMYEGQIKAQGQFKIVVSEHRKDNTDSIFNEINLKQNSRISNNTKKTSKQNLKKNNKQDKKIFLKPKLSQTFIIITPDLFIKKQQVPTTYKNNNIDVGIDMNTDLISKFEMLNKKFSQQSTEKNNENKSIWQDQQENQNIEQNKSRNKFNYRELYSYDIIDQEKQQQQQGEL